MKRTQRVLITGGAGYVGAVLVPALLKRGYEVTVLDLYLFGEDVLSEVKGHPHLEQIKGDIRDASILTRALRGCDAVIHLACISNDPSFELDPELGKSINYDAFEPLVRISKDSGVRRLIYASSSSVYGVSQAQDVAEDHPLNPLTDYSRYKGLCEPLLLEQESTEFAPVVIRPATVCGYSPRMRLDLSVNILTHHAVTQGKIKVFGGSQMRPNIHITDIVNLYGRLIEFDSSLISGKIYNAGWENHSMADIAQMVRRAVEREMPEKGEIKIETVPTDDLRSYHISSEKIKRELGFVPRHTIEDAVRDLVHAFQAGKIPNSAVDPRYYNIKSMQQLQLR